jgi:hypothetical protein
MTNSYLPSFSSNEDPTANVIEIRNGQALPMLEREEFTARFRAAFYHPAFRAEDQSIERLEEIAWQAYAAR